MFPRLWEIQTLRKEIQKKEEGKESVLLASVLLSYSTVAMALRIVPYVFTTVNTQLVECHLVSLFARMSFAPVRQMPPVRFGNSEFETLNSRTHGWEKGLPGQWRYLTVLINSESHVGWQIRLEIERHVAHQRRDISFLKD